jgi:NitT/TauT family transport system permease protein
MARGIPRDPGAADRRPPRALGRSLRVVEWLAFPAGAVLLVAAWSAAAASVRDAYLLPPPSAVWRSLLDNHGVIWWHTKATLAAVAGGFAIGFALAVVLGYIISRSRLLERLITPYVVASQAVPVVAIAPLLVFWFRAGMPVKVATVSLIVFFPMLVSTVVGLHNISPASRELMRALSASRRQTLVWLEIPAALPVLLGGVRVGVTLSVIGAVVGEFLGSDRGLGTLVQIANGSYNDRLMFAALAVLVTVALTLYGAAVAVERAWLRHR